MDSSVLGLIENTRRSHASSYRIQCAEVRIRPQSHVRIESGPEVFNVGEPALIELVKVRVSQLNGCGYCLDMHTQRLYLLNVWREAPLYNERERAALAWADALTRLESQRSG
jgi:AhpD family alkylhydroperoxidase